MSGEELFDIDLCNCSDLDKNALILTEIEQVGLIKEKSHVKTGKHGHAKIVFKVEYYFRTGTNFLTFQAGERVKVPILTTGRGYVVEVDQSNQKVKFTNPKNFEQLESPVGQDTFEVGDQVQYTIFRGNTKISKIG